MAARTTKLFIGLAVVTAVVLGGAYGLHALWKTAKSHLTVSNCTVGSYDLGTDQAAVASTMVGAVTKYRVNLPERAAVLVLAAGLQESKLTNLGPNEGDRDSVGVLPQRPSRGWGGGDPKKLTDVGEATKEFLDALVKVPGWQRLPLSKAGQAAAEAGDGGPDLGRRQPLRPARGRGPGPGRRAAGTHGGRDHLRVPEADPGRERGPGGRAGPDPARDRDPGGGRGADRARGRRPLADCGVVRRQRRPARDRAGCLRRAAVDAQ